MLLIVALELVSSCVVAYLYAALENNLARNGNWIASKAELGMRVMGSHAFVTDRKTLSGEELDLGRWRFDGGDNIVTLEGTTEPVLSSGEIVIALRAQLVL